MPIPMPADMNPDKRPDVSKVIDENLSIMNPQDAFVMAEKGMLRSDMSVRELFERLGVDVEGPVSQLSDMVSREKEKANPLNKMKALAGAGDMSDPVAGISPGRGGMEQNQTSGGSLEDLMKMGGM